MLKQYLSLILGTFVFSLPIVIILSLLYLLPFTHLDVLYDSSLFIPRMLGIVNEVEPEEIVELRGGQTDNIFLEEGRYRIFTSLNLASRTVITLTSQETAEIIRPLYIPPDNRLGSDTDQPQFTFNLDDTGSYDVSAEILGGDPLSDNATYTIEPYVGDQNAAVAIIGGLIQLAIVAFCLRLAYQYIKKDELQELKASQTQKRGEWESFLDEKKKGKET